MTSGKQGIAIEALRDALQGLQIPGSGSYLERGAPSQPLECFAGKPIGPTAREALLFPLFDNAMTGQVSDLSALATRIAYLCGFLYSYNIRTQHCPQLGRRGVDAANLALP
jgi:hypothetical protein